MTDILDAGTPGPAGAGERVAVVGSGISGLTAAYLLSQAGRRVTLYEQDRRLGGHTHTHTLTPGEIDSPTPVRVDSGFIVLNDRTYPTLRRLFAELGVRTQPTEMSMSIRHERTGFEYAGGRGLPGFLLAPRHLADRRFRQMLVAVRRFHRQAAEFLRSSDPDDLTTFGEFIEQRAFGASFTELYAVPVVACVWSSGTGDVLGYPARYLFTFLERHGMLSVGNSPQWMSVVGGSASYIEALSPHLDRVRVGVRVRSVGRSADGVSIETDAGLDTADRVVIATHADEALALLADPTDQERAVLGGFGYSTNEAVLHTDASLLPQRRRMRSSWNYLVTDGSGRPAGSRPVVTYWMNRLQGLSTRRPLLVSLNAGDRVDPSSVIATMSYTHPRYDRRAVLAQRSLPALSGGRTAFAGAHHGWGFHEDGCRSGVDAAAALGVTW